MPSCPPSAIPDIQSTADIRHLLINKVGVKRVRHPILLKDSNAPAQGSVAYFNLYVELPETQKGTHMSRFLELLHDYNEPFSVLSVKTFVERMLSRLNATTGYVEIEFPYFAEKSAPVSGVKSIMDYEVQFLAEIREARYRLKLKVQAPVTSLCPCSKAISAYGAHNQRAHVTISATLNSPVWIEEIIKIIESEASCPLYSLLKRPDEKHVTEQAYENPKFVEDMVRDIAARLKMDARIDAYTVESENFESIHNHSAYAQIQQGK